MARSLPIEISRFQNSDEVMGDLATSAKLDSAESAAQAYAGCAPVIVKALVERCSTPEGASRMLDSAHALTWSERHNPAEIFKNDDPLVGEHVADQIFDPAFAPVVRAVASTSGMKEASAGILIEIASAVTLACLAGEPDQELEFASFMAAVDRAGQAFGVDATLPTSGVQHADEIKATTIAHQNQHLGTASDASSSRPGMAAAAGAGVVGAAAMGSSATGTATQGAAELNPLSNDDKSSKKRSLTPVLALCCLACVALLGGLFLLNGRGSSDATPEEVAFEGSTTTLEIVTTTEAVATTAEEQVDDQEATTTAAPTTAAETASSDTTADDGEANVFTLSVPLADTAGVRPDAVGVVVLDLNTDTGEVCYNIEATNIDGPMLSHIHVGGPNDDGGIVVDLEPRQSGDSGCVANNPGDSMTILDTRAILVDLDGHYVELNDVSEEFSIRGQLSQAPETASVQADVAALLANDDDQVASGADAENDDDEPEVSDPAELLFDPDSDGAIIVVRNGSVVLQGDVADQATADAFVASLSGLEEVPVIDELVVVAGAPAPSGRVLIGDAVLFDDNSDAVKDVAVPTLTAMKELALARPDWVVTIVGHTDSTGSEANNLELSLRRATAVREILRAKGVPEESMRIEGAGETDPVADNNTLEGRAQNRRIELLFTPPVG